MPRSSTVPREILVPNFLKSNPEAQKDWDGYAAFSKARSAAVVARGNIKAAKAEKDIGPDVYLLDVRPTNWRRSDPEWTAPSVTGAVTTIVDNGFSLHFGGMRLHATTNNDHQIVIDDGSIPLQYVDQGQSFGYDNTWGQSTVTQKFQTSWLYHPTSDDGPGGGGWVPNFSKLIITVLAQDSNSNAATKFRLDFYRNFGNELLAVQVIVENLDKGSFIETNVRFNLTDAEVNYITDSGNRSNGPGNWNADNTYILMWCPRSIEDGTVANYDAGQVYGWIDSLTYENITDWDEYSDTYNFFEGVTQTRRVPSSALTTSLYFPRSTSTVTTTAVATSDVKNRDNWIITLGVLVAVLMLIVFSRRN